MRSQIQTNSTLLDGLSRLDSLAPLLIRRHQIVSPNCASGGRHRRSCTQRTRKKGNNSAGCDLSDPRLGSNRECGSECATDHQSTRHTATCRAIRLVPTNSTGGCEVSHHQRENVFKRTRCARHNHKEAWNTVPKRSTVSVCPTVISVPIQIHRRPAVTIATTTRSVAACVRPSFAS